jgi:hypothetical protein
MTVAFFPDITFIVCEGAEYRALSRGLKHTTSFPPIITIPMGINSVERFLQQQVIHQQNHLALLIGLGGSLSPQYQVGEIVAYHSCSYLDQKAQLQTQLCHPQLSTSLARQLNVPLVQGLTANQLVNSPALKLTLQRQSGCQVVDMETFGVMSYFPSLAVIRIISDSYHDELPNLNYAIDSEGKLNNLKMAIAFLQQPLAALKLMRNSLISLKKLEQVTNQIQSILFRFKIG